jgi:hypothetical protein
MPDYKETSTISQNAVRYELNRYSLLLSVAIFRIVKNAAMKYVLRAAEEKDGLPATATSIRVPGCL